jgi:hypothetical protein
MSTPDPEQSVDGDSTPPEGASDAVETEIDIVEAESPAPESAPPTADLGAVQRPGTVTAGAVIAFVLAALMLIATVGQAVAGAMAGATVLFYLPVILNLAFVGLLVWGGIAAWRGATNRILVVTAAAAVVVIAIVSVIKIINGTVPVELLMLILYVVIGVLLIRPQSRQFFVAHGGSAL